MRFAKPILALAVAAFCVTAVLWGCSGHGLTPRAPQSSQESGSAASPGTRRTMNLSQGGQGYCDDGSEAIYGPNGDECADGSLPEFPPVQGTSPQCWDNCFYQPCGYACPPPGAVPPPEWAGGTRDPSPPPNSETYAERIYNAAVAFRNKVTRGLLGAIWGEECVAALQTVLKNAGLSMIGNGTTGASTFLNNLPYSGYSEVKDDNQANAVRGDIVVLTDDSSSPPTHVGICMTNGCTEMLSNSSQAGTFSYYDTPQAENKDAAQNDGNGYAPSTIYYYHHG